MESDEASYLGGRFRATLSELHQVRCDTRKHSHWSLHVSVFSCIAKPQDTRLHALSLDIYSTKCVTSRALSDVRLPCLSSTSVMTRIYATARRKPSCRPKWSDLEAIHHWCTWLRSLSSSGEKFCCVHPSIHVFLYSSMHVFIHACIHLFIHSCRLCTILKGRSR